MTDRRTRYIGVSRRRSVWTAKISHNGKRVNIGDYVSEFDAAVAYDLEVIRIGDGRETNFHPAAIAGYRPRRTAERDIWEGDLRQMNRKILAYKIPKRYESVSA